jgi:hypothetical protein
MIINPWICCWQVYKPTDIEICISTDPYHVTCITSPDQEGSPCHTTLVSLLNTFWSLKLKMLNYKKTISTLNVDY